MESKYLALRNHLLDALDSVEKALDIPALDIPALADDSAINVLSARVVSLEKRVEYLETLFSEIGMNPDNRWSVTEIAGIRKAVLEAMIPF